MKKIIGSLSLLVAVTILSCTNQPEEVKKEVIVVPVETPKKDVIIVPVTPPKVIIQEPVKKPTSITLDKKGVKVESKNVDVIVQP